MMNALALVATNAPLISRSFTQVSVEEQVRNTPFLIYAVLFLSLAAAYLSLWRAATDFRVFRNMGAYLLLVGVQTLTIYFTGDSFQWTLIAVTSPLLVMIAGEAMRVPHRRWSLLVWPLCFLVFFFGWFTATYCGFSSMRAERLLTNTTLRQAIFLLKLKFHRLKVVMQSDFAQSSSAKTLLKLSEYSERPTRSTHSLEIGTRISFRCSTCPVMP